MPYFHRRGRRVELEPLDHTSVLRGGRAALDAIRRHLPPGVDVLAADEEAGALVLTGSVSRVEHAIRTAKLDASVGLGPAYRQLGGPRDDLWAPTGRVSVRLPEGWDRSQVDAVLARRGLRVTEPIAEMPGGYFAATAGNPIEAARALVEEDGALFADPDFIRHMPRRTAAGRR